MTESHSPLGKETPIPSMCWGWKAGHFPKSPSSSGMLNLNWLFWSDSSQFPRLRWNQVLLGRAGFGGIWKGLWQNHSFSYAKMAPLDLMPQLSPSSCPCLKQRHLRATRTLGGAGTNSHSSRTQPAPGTFVPVFPWKSSLIQLSVLQAHKS